MEDTKKLVSERFNLLLDALKLSVPDLARNLRYERSDKLYNISKGKYLPSFEIMSDLTKKFVSINANWLLTGEGSMFHDSKTSEETKRSGTSIDTPISLGEESIIYKMYQDLLKATQEEKAENKALIEEIGGLKERIHQLESQQPPESDHGHIRHGDVPPPHKGLGL